MESLGRSKKIAINTAVLYLRMFAILVINLIAVRLVLRAVGAEDYGIYNVVAGIIAFVGFVGTSIASSTQRFYSYAIGEKDDKKQREVFTASFIIFFSFSLIAFIITEIIGIWLIDTKLVIPLERLEAAKWVFHFSVMSFIATILSIPFSSAIIANENMGTYAAITFSECLLKFISAILLYYIVGDKLFFYGLFILLAHLLVFVAYFLVAKKEYKTICSFVRIKDYTIFKRLVSFSGWSLFGSAAGVLINQGNTILVNMFFGPVVNAARAIALQISNALIMFSSSFTTAIRPPIIKSYAAKNDDYVNKLFSFGNKFIYYAMLMVCIPLFFEMETVLTLWIKDYDADTVIFSRLIIIYTMIMVLHDPITTIIQASGQIKNYYLFTESFTILCMPITYIVYRLGFPALTTFIVMCIAISCSHIARLLVLKKQYPAFSIRNYISSFVVPALMITMVMSVISYFVCWFIEPSYLRMFSIIVVCVLCTATMVFFFALNKSEREMLKELYNSVFHRTKKS